MKDRIADFIQSCPEELRGEIKEFLERPIYIVDSNKRLLNILKRRNDRVYATFSESEAAMRRVRDTEDLDRIMDRWVQIENESKATEGESVDRD